MGRTGPNPYVFSSAEFFRANVTSTAVKKCEYGIISGSTMQTLDWFTLVCNVVESNDPGKQY